MLRRSHDFVPPCGHRDRGDWEQRQVDRGQAEQDREDWEEIRRNR